MLTLTSDFTFKNDERSCTFIKYYDGSFLFKKLIETEMAGITKLQKEGDLGKFLEKNQGYLVVVFFSAEWSEESKLMADVVGEMVKSEQLSRTTRFVQLDAEEFEDTSMKYNVEAVPTFVLLRV